MQPHPHKGNKHSLILVWLTLSFSASFSASLGSSNSKCAQSLFSAMLTHRTHEESVHWWKFHLSAFFLSTSPIEWSHSWNPFFVKFGRAGNCISAMPPQSCVCLQPVKDKGLLIREEKKPMKKANCKNWKNILHIESKNSESNKKALLLLKF